LGFTTSDECDLAQVWLLADIQSISMLLLDWLRISNMASSHLPQAPSWW